MYQVCMRATSLNTAMPSGVEVMGELVLFTAPTKEEAEVIQTAPALNQVHTYRDAQDLLDRTYPGATIETFVRPVPPEPTSKQDERVVTITCLAKGLYSVHSSRSHLSWDSITPTKFKAVDYTHVARSIGLTHEELGKLVVALSSDDVRAACERMGLQYRS